MADSDTISTIKTQTLAIISTITENPKPTYDIDGQEVSWGEYLKQLQATIDWCNANLNKELPFEVHSMGYTP